MTERCRGTLVSDSARLGPAFGIRSAMTSDRSLLFRGAGLSVEIQISPASDGWGMYCGQVARDGRGARLAGALVQLGDARAVTTDEFGQFAVRGHAGAGSGNLHVLTEETELVCEIPWGETDGRD